MLQTAPVSIKTYLFGHTEDGLDVNAYELAYTFHYKA